MKTYSSQSIGAASDKGPARSGNEDAYWVPHTQTPTHLGWLFVVADGVGGQEYGEIASQQAVQIVSDTFYGARRNALTVPDALKQAFLRANQEIFRLTHSQGLQKMGCTLVALAYLEGQAYLAHVGDARIYRLRGQVLQQLTRDDSWIQEQLDARVITPEEVANHELRHVVTQALGNREQVNVHVSEPVPLVLGDTFLLCSDGLHDTLEDTRLADLLKQKPSQAAAALVLAAIEAKAGDNITAVVVQPMYNPKVVMVSPIRPTTNPVWWGTAVLLLLLLLILFILWVL